MEMRINSYLLQRHWGPFLCLDITKSVNNNGNDNNDKNDWSEWLLRIVDMTWNQWR